MKRKKLLQSIFRYFILVLVALVMLYPLLWLFGATFKSNDEIFTTTWFVPKNGFSDFSAWKGAFDTPGWGHGDQGFGLLKAFWNTFQYVIPQVILMTFTCLITAFVVARIKFKGKKVVFALIIGTLLMPNTIFRIPMYLFWQSIGSLWQNTKLPFIGYLPLWGGSLFAVNSFSIFMFIQFFRTIPRELDEAAYMDGANKFQLLFKVLVPTLKPIIITVALLLFISSFNEFEGPLIYIVDVEKYTLSQVLRLYVSVGSTTTFAEVYARSFISLLPSILVFFIGQKYFVNSMTDSSIKG